MVKAMVLIAGFGLAVNAFVGLTFLISSIWEKEKRASFFGALQLAGMLALSGAFLLIEQSGFFYTRAGTVILGAGILLSIMVLAFLALKIGENPEAVQGTLGLKKGEIKRFDEREVIFARNRTIRPESREYEIFYSAHPEYEDYDAQRRKKGGPLGQLGTIDRPNEGPNIAATMASLSIPFFLSTPPVVKPERHPAMAGKKIDLSPREATDRIKGYAKSLGADLVGITELNPFWIYSHKGEIFHENWEDWGKEIVLNHKYAVVFAMEMALDMIGPAPHTTTTIESMRNYARGAYIATQLANFIANLGYCATANHLRYYETILVPLAVDAGLGELGRNGYLITKEYGPRVRLGAVTTDLPLVPDKPVDIGVKDFCDICKKCSVCCPSNSIPLGERAVVNGTLRWKLNAETCFEYWGKIGTDCNVCMRVCPWSHARTLPHKLIVFLITRNKYSRRLFSILDDIFYGKKPKPKAPPSWAKFDGL